MSAIAISERPMSSERQKTSTACSFPFSMPNVQAETIVKAPPTISTHQSTFGNRVVLCDNLVRRYCASERNSEISWSAAVCSAPNVDRTDITEFHISEFTESVCVG